VMRRSVRMPAIGRLTVDLGAPERVEHDSAQAGDVAVVARHQCQAIGQRGRREQAIDNPQRGLIALMRPH